MKMSNLKWEIIHIPPNPPFLPTQQPTSSVFASVVDPKMANSLVRKLNQIAPMETFRHVKRVRRSSLDGKTELSVILCLAGDNDADLGSMPKNVLQLIHSYQLSPFVTQVCKYSATTKEEWEEQCKLWPTSFHPPTYNIEGITGFSEEDSKLVFNYMSFALKLAKSGCDQLTNAAVIVDPSVDQIIASACDETYSWHISRDDNVVQLLEANEPSASHGVANGSSSYNQNVKGSTNYSKLSYWVSCSNPWEWSWEHQQSSSSYFWHPLRHAAMVAIEHSAARDRRLFPTTEKFDENSVQDVQMENSVIGSPAKRPRRSSNNVKISEEALTNGFLSNSDRPYLCTGYDVYLAREPCAMQDHLVCGAIEMILICVHHKCAMALLHQRVRRIFYAFPNPNTGALGSVYRLQGEKSLNHHYAVFRVILHDEPLGNPEESVTISGE